MKQIAYILAIILFTACGQSKRGLAEKSTNLQKDTLDEKSMKLSLDTLKANNYLLTFENAVSFEETDIYGDLDYRKKITNTIRTSYFDKARKIQSYLLTNRFKEYFYLTDSTLVLKLADGNTMSFNRYVEERDLDNDGLLGYIFAHYFDQIDYYLLILQYYEGSSWMLVNRKNGFKKDIYGLPYISEDNKKIIAINSDLEAGYNFNGIALYTILTDSLQMEFRKETEWGPLDVKWINESEFLLKREHFHVDSTIIDYKRVRIEKMTCL
jgi:hypothetical protein